ncbi:competence protein CoiA [Priestia megaterium]|nr:competence protein CoiA [Priestia megaterium]
MLVAKTKYNELLSLAHRFSYEELKEWQKNISFYCPSCHQPVQLKVGIKRSSHFAHFKQTCIVQHEGETDYHLDGKKKLFQWFYTHLPTRLEYYLPEIMQRPDLTVQTAEEKYAIEFQCASLSTDLLVKRSHNYKQLNYVPLWIMGAKRLKRLSAYMFQLSQQEWQYTHMYNGVPMLHYFSPSTNQLLKLEHLIPFSPQIVFAHLTVLSPKIHTFEDLTFPHTTPSFYDAWIKKKKVWRTQYMLYPNKKYASFLKKLYELRIPPSHIPAEAGFPLPSLFMIETPAVIWQTWLLIDMLASKSIGSIVSSKQLYMQLTQRIRQGEIQLRSLPLQHSTIEQPLFEYIEALCKIGLLKSIGSELYKVARSYTIPPFTSDSFMEDGLLINKWLNQAKEVTHF